MFRIVRLGPLGINTAMVEPIVAVVHFGQSGLSLLAEADRFIEHWGNNAEMDYARSVAQLGPRNPPVLKRERNGAVSVGPFATSALN